MSGGNYGLRALLSKASAPFRQINLRLGSIERKIDQLEYHSHGARATYVGRNRILVKIVVERRNIAYLVEADDLLISPWFIITGTYETELTDFFVSELKPDSHCIDVGSNFGYFTCLMGRFSPAGRVIAIEADQRVAELARDNIAINGFERRARAIHAAASDSSDSLTFYRRGTRSGNTSVVPHDPSYIAAMGEPPAEQFKVAGVRLDDLAEEFGGRLDFIKIDAEGSEPLVIRGALGLIASNPQLKIVMEWSPGQISSAGFDVPSFVAELGQIGLSFFKMVGTHLEPLSPAEILNLEYTAGIVLTTKL